MIQLTLLLVLLKNDFFTNRPFDICTRATQYIFANLSLINLVSVFRCSSSKTNPVYARRVNSLLLVCSLSSHRHSYIPLIFGSRFIDS